ncbi:hypothetical protein [Paenibacillus agricola]|uniref:Uncharacterized protein n=1 Tax=Paenibacillus agricola TaxID=2716264 RepID=A0ABX0J3F4_9BACL|nr:hypothetical protein [Paenibacillus agricola]NHN30677.1 hypothetical protein [Paenibacillus agricola]
MIQFGSLHYAELKFEQIRATTELRDAQWIDVLLRFELKQGSVLPEDLTELSALIICTYAGAVAQIVPQDEGRDCEFQFTEDEKEQLLGYYEQNVKQELQAQFC